MSKPKQIIVEPTGPRLRYWELEAESLAACLSGFAAFHGLAPVPERTADEWINAWRNGPPLLMTDYEPMGEGIGFTVLANREIAARAWPEDKHWLIRWSYDAFTMAKLS